MSEAVKDVALPAEGAAEACADEAVAQARIQEMFALVPGNQKVFMDTMEACREPQTPASLNELMSAILATNRSVFAPPELRAIMERHGVLRYEPSIEEQEALRRAEKAAAAGEEEPVEVDEEGYLVIRVPAEGTWQLTEAALTYLDSDPLGAYAQVLFAENDRYLPVFRTLLSLVAEGPRSRETIDAAIDPLPALQIPRVYAGYFTGEMEKAGAMTWNDGWEITERGRALLEALSAMEEGE